LWANRAQFAEVTLRTVSEQDIVEVCMPSMQGDVEDDALEALTGLTMEEKPVDIFSTPPQLDGELVTLTLLPRSRWQTLLNLEVIQQRNQPIEPPKKPEQAPFFLPTLPSVEHRFATEEKKEEKAEKKTRRDKTMTKSRSILQTKLAKLDGMGDCDDEVFDYIKSLSPPAIDVELRSLVAWKHLRQFIHVLQRRLQSHKDFEAVQTLQNVFLRIHGETLLNGRGLLPELEELLEIQEKESERILELLASSLGTLGFVRDTI